MCARLCGSTPVVCARTQNANRARVHDTRTHVLYANEKGNHTGGAGGGGGGGNITVIGSFNLINPPSLNGPSEEGPNHHPITELNP